MGKGKRFLVDEAATEALGAELAKITPAGGTWLLNGEMGSGKTSWTRGFVAGLGGFADQVASPTFSLLHRYEVFGAMVFHLDLYRIGETGSWSLGLEEVINEADYLVVEWAGDSGPWPSEWVARLRIDICEKGRLAHWILPKRK